MQQQILQKPDETPKKISKAELAKKLESMRERDHELVTGIFRYIEKPKGKLSFTFGGKYPGDEFKRYDLIDGQRYKLPRMVARHLNQNCYYVEYTRIGGKLGMASGNETFMAGTGNEDTYANMYAQNKIHRTEFRSLEFMDDDISAGPDITEIVYR